MIKLTWMQMAHPHFEQALRSIWDCPMLDAKTSYTAGRLKKALEKVQGDVRDYRIGLIKKYGKKGEDGKVLSDENGHIIFENPDDNQKFEAEFRGEFESRVVELKVNPLDFEKLTNVRGITPGMWEHLTPVLTNLPPDEEEVTLPQIPEGELEA